MNKQLFSTLMFIATLTGLMFATAAQARMKCWTNNEGVMECGDKVPPEYAQKGHKEIGESGIVREEVERAKTPEELAEERRLAKEEEERLKMEEQKRLKDKILLETFANAEDIERARDERITAIEATIKLTQARIEKIQADLDKRIASAAADERAGKKPSAALLKDIDNLKRQIKDNEEFIADKRLEQEDIRVSHADDIARFKKLKGIE